MLNLPYNGPNDFGDWLARGLDKYKANYDLAFGYAVEVELVLPAFKVEKPLCWCRIDGLEVPE
jgi:hypothetical protein